MDIQQMQRELDQMVLDKERERGVVLDKETLLQYTLSALRVELAELQNEMKTEPGGFGHWKTKPMDINKAREEAIDCLHFLVSTYNQIGKNFKFYNRCCGCEIENLDRIFNFMYAYLYELKIADESQECDFFEDVMARFSKSLQVLFSYLGMSIKDIEEEYQRKYEINIQRQNNGY